MFCNKGNRRDLLLILPCRNPFQGLEVLQRHGKKGGNMAKAKSRNPFQGLEVLQPARRGCVQCVLKICRNPFQGLEVLQR